MKKIELKLNQKFTKDGIECEVIEIYKSKLGVMVTILVGEKERKYIKEEFENSINRSLSFKTGTFNFLKK